MRQTRYHSAFPILRPTTTMTFTLNDAAYATDTPEAKQAMYADLRSQLQGLLSGETDFIANTANFSSLVFHTMPGLNWAGFYFLKGEELVLGPFQGKPACIRIKKGRGVCGTTVVEGKSIVVQDVHAFPGHIACDVNSRSELVVPLFANGQIVGVFDLDSPLTGRFDDVDAQGVESLVRVLEAAIVAE
ncbi:free methionine-R-sulfoxide reductase [Janthinobacterium sp. HH107]|nr:free methionine-R-sulfoxide reductase [Janthinobacterium sp. HH107]